MQWHDVIVDHDASRNVVAVAVVDELHGVSFPA
jgi:hypothetical protein